MSMKTKPSYLWHINMKYEIRSFILLGSNMKYENISHFEREQKYDMKYEIWRAWAKIWNMKYENIKIQRTKNVTISGFFFANMKYGRL